MTAKDMISACFLQTECVGGSYDNKIRCHIRKISTPDWKDKARALSCYYSAEEYRNREKYLDKVSIDLTVAYKDLVRNMSEAAEKGGMDEKLRMRLVDHGVELDKLKSDVQSYENELRKLTDEYFNTTDLQ